jgi:hypothetical protein
MRQDDNDMIFHRPSDETNCRQSEASAGTRYLTEIIGIKEKGVKEIPSEPIRN